MIEADTPRRVDIVGDALMPKNRRDTGNRRMQRAGRLAPLVILLAFAALAFWQTLMLTPCCADDSYFAMIARELAATGHFGVPLSNTRFSDFDVENGGGPAL